MKTLRLILLTSLCLTAPSALADDMQSPKPLGPEFCFPIGDLIKTLEKFDGLKASKRDTVGPDMSLTIELDEGEIMPERVELRDGDSRLPVVFDEDNRSVDMPSLLRQSSRDGKFCVIDPAREGRLFKEVGYTFDFGMGVRFKNNSGTHTLAEIEDGLKDGRSHYKKMAGAMGFMVPKFDYIAISGDDDANPPVVFAMHGGQDIGEPAFERYDNARMIAVETLEDMGADAIRIEEGYYRMTPSPDAKTVAKFSGDGDDKDDG